MSHALRIDSAQEREFQADRLAEAVAALWLDGSRQQTEAAVMLSRIVTHDEPRIPNEHEVRGFLKGAVRGALVKAPPPPKSVLRRITDYLTKWDD
jgi:hypothetical protein